MMRLSQGIKKKNNQKPWKIKSVLNSCSLSRWYLFFHVSFHFVNKCDMLLQWFLKSWDIICIIHPLKCVSSVIIFLHAQDTTVTIVWFQNTLVTPKGNSHTWAAPPHPPPGTPSSWQLETYFPSLWICLWRTFPTSGIVYCVTFWIWLLWRHVSTGLPCCSLSVPPSFLILHCSYSEFWDTLNKADLKACV